MKNTLLISAVVVLVLLVGVFYFTREPQAPTEEVSQGVVGNLEETNEEKDIYTISNESEVSYSLGELLNNEPTTVLGKTNVVGGEIAFNPENISDISIGTIRVNARTFTTDSSRRDGAVVNLILESNKDENEFITFEPHGITVSDETATSAYIVVHGTLTISGVSKDIEFSGTLSFETNLSADLEAKISRSNFNLVVPDFPFLADVEDTLMLHAHIETTRQ